MSDMQPKGVVIEIGGVERRLLFTIAAVDEIQAKYEKPISDVIAMMADDNAVTDVVFNIMSILINDEINRNRFFRHADEQNLTEKELKWLLDLSSMPEYVGSILKAYGLSLPEQEEDDPNAESRSN